MKAAVLEQIGKLDVRDIPVPPCPDEGLLIRVGACAVCGTDVKVYRHGHRLIAPPRVTGHEIAGTVVEVGKNSRPPAGSEPAGGSQEGSFKVGDRVAVAPAVPCGECRFCRRGQQTMCDRLTAIGYKYDGGFAEFMAVPPVAARNGCVNRVPDSLTLEEAALAEPLACCINAQELCRVSLGQSVAIIGAGPIGCLHVQLARANGATKAILIDLSANRLRMAQVVHADAYIDSSRENAVERVKAETDGYGADVVIVACSSGTAQEQGLEMVSKRGVVNFFGGLPKDSPYIRFDSNLAHYREFSVVGNHGAAPRHNELALALLGAGKIRAKELITHRFGITDTLKGILTTEQALGLKVVIAEA